jgi:hypothetical protein
MLDWTTIHLLAARGAAPSKLMSAPHAPRSLPQRAFVVPALILFGVVAVAFWIAMSLGRKDAEIRVLPAAIRAQILQNGASELRTICREPSAVHGPLRARCIEQAKFVLALPECGPACQAAATAVLPHGRR